MSNDHMVLSLSLEAVDLKRIRSWCIGSKCWIIGLACGSTSAELIGVLRQELGWKQQVYDEIFGVVLTS